MPEQTTAPRQPEVQQPRVWRWDEPHTEAFTDDTLVDFEGEVTRWGDLMLADRKAWMHDGGYPF
jgi:hypothetical protein